MSTLQVDTNSFLMSRLPSKSFNQYQISFDSRKELKRREQIQYFHRLQNVVRPDIFRPRMIYDGASIAYCASILNFNGSSSGRFTISLGSDKEVDKEKGITIVIARTGAEPIHPRDIQDIFVRRNGQTNTIISAKAQVAINLIQMIVRQWPNMHHTNNGRAYFPSNGQHKQISGGLELWRGIFQSVRPSMFQTLVLQIDSCTAAVYRSGSLIDVCLSHLNRRDIRDLRLQETHPDFKRLEKFLKKVKVTYIQPSKRASDPGAVKTKIIHGLVEKAGLYRFMLDDREISVAEYWERMSNTPIRNREIIGVRFTPRSAENQVIVPLECCTVIPGQLFKKKIPENLTSEVVRFATLKPHDKKSHIVAAAALYATAEFVSECDMQIQNTPVSVTSRRLRPPPVEFANGPLQPNNGAWNLMGRRLLDTRVSLQDYGIINFCAAEMPGKAFEAKMMDFIGCCSKLGMKTGPPAFIISGHGQSPAQALNEVASRLGTTAPVTFVVFVILPENSAQLRQSVKYWGDIQHGIITQCMRMTNIKKPGNQSQYWNNVALKVNARLGGINSTVKSPALGMTLNGSGIPGEQQHVTIIMGADASHPGPGVQKPTTTSLVFSTNPSATHYRAYVGIQEPRTEIIVDLKEFVVRAIMEVGARAKKSPTRIVFFRDGVSEGEYAKVEEIELAAIDSAIELVWTKKKVTDPKPKVTFIVVGKRHHAVFFPGQGAADRTGNCQAGTVIDEGVTQPTVRDFYLQSHSAIQGTVRSAHYIVLRDEIFPNTQAIQEVAYALCHVYAKATRSVSIPAPVYYADLVCARGAIHLDPDSPLRFGETGSTISGPEDSLDLAAWRRDFKATNTRLKPAMYFL